MITIRDFQLEDLELITAIFNEIVAEGSMFMTKDALSSLDMAMKLAAMKYVAVAQLDSAVVGCYWIHDNMPGRGSHIANGTYCVCGLHRRKGIGRRLGEHSLSTAIAMGYTGMQFNGVVCQNKASVHLWESLGFMRVGVIPGGFRAATGACEDVAIYYKHLADAKTLREE